MHRTLRYRTAPRRTASHCIASHCIALHCIASHRFASHRIASHRMASHCIALHCIVSHGIALHRIALHCIVLLVLLYDYEQMKTVITLVLISLNCWRSSSHFGYTYNDHGCFHVTLANNLLQKPNNDILSHAYDIYDRHKHINFSPHMSCELSVTYNIV